MSETDERREERRAADSRNARQSRATETDEHREERRAANRRNARQARDDERARRRDLLADDAQLHELMTAGVPVPLSEEGCTEVEAEALDALWGDKMSEAACAVCDELVVFAELHEVELRDGVSLVDKMRVRLRAPPDLRSKSALLEHYRVVSPGVRNFDEVLLSPRGVSCWPNASEGVVSTHIRVCRSCRKSLQRSGVDETRPPKFAIANHFAIGLLPPELADCTPVEVKLISLVSVSMATEVLRGGANRVLKSHVAVFDARPSHLVEALPRMLTNDADESFMVILAGPMTSAQELAARRAHRVRGDRLRALYHFFHDNNDVYTRATLDGSRVHRLNGDESHVVRDASDGGQRSSGGVDSAADDGDGDDRQLPLAEQMEVDAANVRQRIDADVASDATEETLVRQGGAVHVARDAGATDDDVRETVRSNLGSSPSVPATVVVRQRGALVPDLTHALLAMMFPALFPFGRGHPDESSRRVRVSVQECVRHYLMLSTRVFARDRMFVLATFDMLARRHALVSATLRCRLPAATPENVAVTQVTVQQLDVLLGYESVRRAAMRRNAAEPPEPAGIGNARVLMRRVRAAAAHVWASNQERAMWRRRAFAMQLRYGNPAVFVTISPKDNGAVAVSYLAGELDIIDRLADITVDSMPSTSRCFTASSVDSVAAARYFGRVVSVFIETVLGFDRASGRPRRRGGVYGHVRAYIGGVETQGDGTLHLHMLLWLYEVARGQPLVPPPTASLVEDVPVNNGSSTASTSADEVYRACVNYVNSLLSLSTPLRPCDGPCLSCDKSPAPLVDDEAPPTGYQAARRGTAPPTLSHCTQCGSKFAADTLIKSAIQRSLRELLGEDTDVTDVDACCLPLVSLPRSAWSGVPLGQTALGARRRHMTPF